MPTIVAIVALVTLLAVAFVVARSGVLRKRRVGSIQSQESWATGTVLSTRPLPGSRFPIQATSIRLASGTCVEAFLPPGCDAPVGSEVKLHIRSFYTVSGKATAKEA